MKAFEFVPKYTEKCRVTAWIQSENNHVNVPRPAIIICPGGGYTGVSEREAEPVAEPYFAAGYNVFILYYSVGEAAKNLVPLRQLGATIAEIRKNADVWHIDRDKIAVCGFSAGGHLACSLGVFHNKLDFQNVLGEKVNVRPNAMILGYPVITADSYAHVGSIERVSGASAGSAGYLWFGLDNHVDSETPPAFIWHTAGDRTVPVENSLRLAAMLSAAKVPFELHVFPYGCHGMSVCTSQVGSECTYNGRWVEMSIIWLNKMFQSGL